MQLSQRSIDRLAGVHSDLVEVVHKAVRHATAAGFDFAVLEGMRSEARQKQLVAQGASKTMRSRHLTGHAVDLGAMISGKVDWHWELYERLNTLVQAAAIEVGVPVEWGGSWTSFKDGPHFQLPWARYP